MPSHPPQTKTFADIIDRINQFDNAREGRSDLQPADLAKSIMIEWAELLEHFQRDMKKQLTHHTAPLPKDHDEIASEVADVFIYLFKFCRQMEIDPYDAIITKLDKTAQKYPIGYEQHTSYSDIKRAHRISSPDTQKP